MTRKRSELTVIVCPATRRDGAAAKAIFEAARIESDVVPSLEDAASISVNEFGAIVLSDLALPAAGFSALVTALERQPTWSDIPVVLMAATGLSMAVQQASARLSNVTVIDRPASTRTLLNAVQAGLRARARQYQMRDQLELLATTEEALRTADRSKDEFLATLAHELRNPLAPIRSALQVLSLKASSFDAQTSKMLGVMDRQLRVMVRLIDDLLDIARISSGKVTLQRSIVDLHDVVDLAIEAARPGIVVAGHILTVDVPERAVMVDADSTRMGQVFGNLLNNATKYTDNGGKIDVKLEVQDDCAVVTISDSGEGIPTNLLGRVFEMFAQVNQTLDRAQGGLGIGLALVRRIVEMHGGSVFARSAGLKKGSEFVVKLPLATHSEGSAISGDLDAAKSSRESLSILVVDDNRDAADTLALVLTMRGHKVAVEYGGAAAIAAAQRLQPAVIFSDIGMPEVNGFDVARALKVQDGRGAPLLAAITGWGSDDDRRRSCEAGFQFHLTKPVTADGIDAVLASVPLVRG